MTHYWFGDSWVVGNELELQVPYSNRWNYVFAKLVSDYFNVSSVNCASSASAPDSLPWEFNKIVKKVQPGDVAFFCLSAMHRFSAFNDNKELLQLIPGPNYSGYAHPYTEKWFKYFDNEPTRLYNYDRTVNLLWLLTKHFGMTCYFVNLFTTAPTSDMDITPDYAWLLPRNKCLSEFIIPVNGDFDGIVVSDDSAFLTNDQWKSQKVALEQYIKPGYCHPNVIGHRHIADRLIEILEKR